MPAPVDLLRSVPLFKGLEDNQLQMLSRTMKDRTFRAGQSVATEGQGGVGFFVVEAGEATITVAGEEKGKVGPGDYFGEVALIDEGARSATITADSDLKCWGMTPWEFRPLVESNASIAWPLLKMMAERLRRAEQR
jgi:CRP/FNR family cyclic AMP-dependent transcriptional regulator